MGGGGGGGGNRILGDDAVGTVGTPRSSCRSERAKEFNKRVEDHLLSTFGKVKRRRRRRSPSLGLDLNLDLDLGLPGGNESHFHHRMTTRGEGRVATATAGDGMSPDKRSIRGAAQRMLTRRRRTRGAGTANHSSSKGRTCPSFVFPSSFQTLWGHNPKGGSPKLSGWVSGGSGEELFTCI